MAAYKYSTELAKKENTSRAVGRDLAVSTKHCIEICNSIRGKTVEKARKLLNDVVSFKRALKFNRFKGNISHKKVVGPGRYPQKACNAVLDLIDSAEANAQFKGLNVNSLVISHVCAKKGSSAYHYGRQGGRKAKRTNFEIVLEEVEQKKEEKKKRGDVKK